MKAVTKQLKKEAAKLQALVRDSNNESHWSPSSPSEHPVSQEIKYYVDINAAPGRERREEPKKE